MNYKRIHRHYAYTLQGWLKDINGYRVDINSTGVYDIGEDGSTTNYVNKRFGRDLFSSMIQFYQTDYSPISGNNYFNLVSTNSIDLYNGNISAISVGIKNLDPLLKSYCYDKINRIKVMTSAGLNNSVWGTLSNLFGSTYSYDFNGNIDTLIRYDQNGNLLHNIRYTYSADRNRLSSINVSGTGIGSSSYQYDALGNLIRDNNENINVTWNVIGKVKSVQTPNNMLSFAYNPFGQRQIKRTANDSTYYIHDATGNVMSIYVKDYPKIIAKERPIYGNSRVGIMTKEIVFNLTGNFLSKSNSTIGIKEYELCDHLSNVSVVVLDRKDCYNSVFKPIVKTYTDYYPFGYPISSRTDNVDYRYGFNGQEGDDEIYGNYKSYNFEFRNYDSRIGRWWSIDKMSTKYSNLSPYSFTNNNPIINLEINGKDFILSVYKRDGKNYITIKQTIYPQNSVAAAELKNSVKELNNLTQKITIDNIEYIINFDIKVFPLPNDTECPTIKDQGTFMNNSFSKDPYGNFYFQYQYLYKNSSDGTPMGGVSYNGKGFMMFRIPMGNKYSPIWGEGIEFPELMVHEILHLLGLTDKGGDYYDPNGRMYYNFTYTNFKMKPISTLDVINIIKYAIKNNNIPNIESAKVKIEYEEDMQIFNEESVIHETE